MADDVVLVNERGEVVETTIANLAVRMEGEWLTPPLDAGCLPGVYREELIDQGALREQALTVGDLVEADEVAVVNSVQGWRAGKLLEHGCRSGVSQDRSDGSARTKCYLPANGRSGPP